MVVRLLADAENIANFVAVMREVSFTFRQFSVNDRRCGMKIGTDGVVLGAWADCRNAKTAIDIGCGSGLIALMIAQRSDASVTAVELDRGAYLDAVDNVAHSPWRDRISVIEGDFSAYRPIAPADLIVSNPPFFASGELSPSASRAGARHEGSLNYSTLIDYAAEYLSPLGRLAFIYDAGREDDIIYKAEMKHLKLRRICRLRQREDRPYIRTLYEFSPTDGPIETDTLTICGRDGRHSDGFRTLTQDFYL